MKTSTTAARPGNAPVYAAIAAAICALPNVIFAQSDDPQALQDAFIRLRALEAESKVAAEAEESGAEATPAQLSREPAADSQVPTAESQVPASTQLAISRAERDFRISKFISDYRAYEAEISRARGSVTFGTTGDSTETQDQFKANAGIAFELGTFPTQLRVNAKADVRSSGGDLVEDVSTFLVNLDHYFAYKRDRTEREACRRLVEPQPERAVCTGLDAERPTRFIESYAFMERFADSFLSIDRRYEVGAGLKLEWHSWALNDEGEEAKGKLQTVVTSLDDARAAFGQLPNTTDDDFESVFSASTLQRAETFIRNRFSKWEAGIAFSLFRETERPAEIETIVRDAAGEVVPDAQGNETRKLRPPTTNTDRLTIRPSFVWRPLREIELSMMYYYKPALGSGSRVNGIRDVRRDASLSAQWKPGTLVSGKRAPTIGLTFEWHKDALPPSVADLVVVPEGGSASRLFADKSHRIVRLEARVDF